MKIGVSGASGHLGRAVVSELLQRPRGHEVVAITRTPENVSGPAQGRFGDYNRPESLAEAYAGLDRLLIITTVDPEPGKRGAQIIAATDAAVKAGVKHIVLMSAAGTRQEEEPARGACYWRGEQHLIGTAPAWTILRMNFYAEAFVQLAQAALNQGVLTGLAENRAAFVARGDVAAAIYVRIGVRGLDHSRDAIDLVATTINTLRLVEHTILGEDLVDRRSPARGIVFTEGVVKIARQQSRNAVGLSLPRTLRLRLSHGLFSISREHFHVMLIVVVTFA